MLNKNKHLTHSPLWQLLKQHRDRMGNVHMRDLFAQNKDRSSALNIRVGELSLDYSRNRITAETLTLLCQLAESVELRQQIEDLFRGDLVNISEKRAALHTALRDPAPRLPEIKASREKLSELVDKIHRGEWRGITGKPIRYIVNIGIGGSHLGPMMAVQALKDFAIHDFQFHFISSVDAAQLKDVLAAIEPDQTLFIISSKTFGTLETLTNAQSVLDWMKNLFGDDVMQQHFIALTAAKEKANAFGVPGSNIYPLWEWVGGRFSLWSAIGLPLQLMIGNKQFNEFLAGAHAMDQHFRTADFHDNMPVIMALLTIWYVNFFSANAHAIIPYSHRLRYFIPYLQQTAMESNGKAINRQGEPVDYLTCPVIFGGEGCNGQHSYHQLLHQGQHIIPADIILLDQPFDKPDKHHYLMLASGLSQAQALMQGKTGDESLQELLDAGYAEENARELAPHRIIPGNRPNNVLHLRQLNPQNLGALIALYEHKIFVEGMMWNINPFDQWGVELGKQLLPDIMEKLGV